MHLLINEKRIIIKRREAWIVNTNYSLKMLIEPIGNIGWLALNSDQSSVAIHLRFLRPFP